MHNATLIFIICVIVVAGCNRGSPSKMILGEGQSTAEGLSLTNGNVILKEGQPGLAFAFAMKPSQSKEFTYILVFNHDVIWRLKQYSPFALQTVPFSLEAPSSISLVLFDSLFFGRRPGWHFGTV